MYLVRVKIWVGVGVKVRVSIGCRVVLQSFFIFCELSDIFVD